MRGANSGLPTAIDLHVGDRAKRVRMLRNISLFQLARRLEIAPEQLARYEAGSQRFPTECLLHLCDALDTTPSFLFSGDVAPRDVAVNSPNDKSNRYVNDNYFREVPATDNTLSQS
jgi:transcriptional regulator with XRE-family HTH domain